MPVVERVPFVPPRWLSGLRFFGAFDRGTETPVYQVGMGRFGAIICYESTFEDLPRLPYTGMVVAESLRLFPPAWVIGRQAARPVELAGHQLPTGATLPLAQRLTLLEWAKHADAVIIDFK